MKKKPRKFKFFSVRTLLLFFVALVLGFSIYSWNAESLMGNKMPMPLGYGCSVVLSGSMEPELHVNDLVFIKRTDDIKVNDVVIYQDNNSLTIHRVIKINGDEITTQGDANNTADEPIKLGQVKGVMIGKIPYAGMVVQVLKQPAVIIILLALAVLLAEFSFRREKQEQNDDLDAIKQEIEELIKDINDKQ